MDEILVSVENVSRCYGDGERRRAALTSISCRVLAGDRVAVVGPSGSGKSTLLHLMAGLDRPTSGVVDWYADVPGLVAKTGETVQTTGEATVLGIDAAY